MINTELLKLLESFRLIIPETILAIGFLVLVFMSIIKKISSKHGLVFLVAMFFVLLYLVVLSFIFKDKLEDSPVLSGFNGLLYIDSASVFFRQLVAFSVFVMLLHQKLLNYKFEVEVYILIFSIFIGLCFMLMSTHFLLIFVSLEMVSISTYITVALNKQKLNFEAAIKYLIFGGTTSAIMLYGISIFYGMSHTLNFSSPVFSAFLAANSPEIVQVTAFFFLGGLLFKAAVAPFQSWVPDVYEATPTPIVSFMSFAPKVAAFLLIARFLNFVGQDLNVVLVLVILLSLVIGNLSALSQTNAKRMLAYSGIAQSGFILIGLLRHDGNNFYSSFFYILAYLPITMGSFLLLDILKKLSGSFSLESYKGLGKNNIILGVNSLVIMVALIGLPPTVGFLAKFMIFSSLLNVESNTVTNMYYGLLIFGLLNAAISIYYYLKIPYYMLIKSGNKTEGSTEIDLLAFVLSFFSIAILFFFFAPATLTDAVNTILF